MAIVVMSTCLPSNMDVLYYVDQIIAQPVKWHPVMCWEQAHTRLSAHNTTVHITQLNAREVPRPLWNPKVHYRVYNSQLLVHKVKVVLEIVQKWFTTNRMLLNYNKTNFVQFSSNFSYGMKLWMPLNLMTMKSTSPTPLNF
jgi:hypothetical protein